MATHPNRSTDSTVLGVRLSLAELAELKAAADADDRPVSVKARQIIRDWLRRQKPAAKPRLRHPEMTP